LREVEQLPLLPEKKVVSRPVSMERIYTLADTHEALEYGCELAKLAPKQVYPHMECDKTVWSRITTGELDLDGRDILRFDRVVNNDAYLLHLVHIHGYDLTSLRKNYADEQERENAELRKENEELRRVLEYVLDKGKR
jgi:hypothetical protein